MISSPYPVCGRSISADLRQSMRAAHLKALHIKRSSSPCRKVDLPTIELAALTEHLERIIILLEGECYDCN